MTIVNIPTAESDLSRWIDQLETGAETEIIISRDGKPAARIVPLAPSAAGDRPLGLAAGEYDTCDQAGFDEQNSLITELFGGKI